MYTLGGYWMDCEVLRRGRCLLLMEDCLAVQVQKVGPTGKGPPQPDSTPAQQYWMYDSGYLLFQGFLESNLKCFWDLSLVTAVRGLEYRGYVSPGILLVSGSPCALEVLRTAWSRNLLKPPPNHTIISLGDVEECRVSKVRQVGFTPLPDAVCWVILDLGASGQHAVLDTIRDALLDSFPSMEQPSTHLLYDTLADLMADNKVYQTAQGYFVATPDSVRLVEGMSNRGPLGRSLLMSTAETMTRVHGEITTIREGSRTHQAIQTNLADVICGGNKSDKILFPRSVSTKNQSPRKLERRHSMKLLGSSKRLASLHRAGSVRLLQPTNSTAEISPKKSLLSRIFRWSKKPNAQLAIETAQPEDFPPQEWFNATVLHLQSVGTQTQSPTSWESDWSEVGTLRSRRRSLSTSRLPRRSTSRALSSSPSQPCSRPASPTPTFLKPSSTPKAMSSASSGYNSLPRSVRSKSRPPSHSVQSTPRSSPRHQANSLKLEFLSQPGSSKSLEPSSGPTLTTINTPTSTKIYLQQQNSPIRSVITLQNHSPPSKPSKDDKDRANKIETKKYRRPLSMYQSDPPPQPVFGRFENNLKKKFPSTETIQLEEKQLTNLNKNNITVQSDSKKAGSLIDVANQIESEMNNLRKNSVSLSPLQTSPTTEKQPIDNINIKNNVLKDSVNVNDSLLKKEDNNISFKTTACIKTTPTIEKTIDLPAKPKQLSSFPSLSDLSLHFTSIAAQNILNGVSINSIDTLVEVNMAAEKSNNKDITLSSATDLGVV